MKILYSTFLVVCCTLTLSGCNSVIKKSEEVKVEPQSNTPIVIKTCAELTCEKANKNRVMRLFEEVINNQNTPEVFELYAKQILNHQHKDHISVQEQEVMFNELLIQYPNHKAVIKHSVADGPYVAIHWHFSDTPNNEFLGEVRVDLFKFENERIVETWNITSTLKPTTASGNSTMSDLYPYLIKPNVSQAQEEENKTFVKDFYLTLFNEAKVGLIDSHLDPIYLQHNPWVKNGPDALKQLILRRGPKPLQLTLALAEDDLVWTFRIKNNLSLVDLFRVDNSINKIVEHWDVF